MISTSRESYERNLRSLLAEDKGPACDESEIAEFSRIMYDEFDSKAELTRIFMNEEIADYLLTFLDTDDVKQVLKNWLLFHYSSVNPAATLSSYFIAHSDETRNEILDRMIEIYSRFGQERLHKLTKRIKTHYLFRIPYLTRRQMEYTE